MVDLIIFCSPTIRTSLELGWEQMGYEHISPVECGTWLAFRSFGLKSLTHHIVIDVFAHLHLVQIHILV